MVLGFPNLPWWSHQTTELRGMGTAPGKNTNSVVFTNKRVSVCLCVYNQFPEGWNGCFWQFWPSFIAAFWRKRLSNSSCSHAERSPLGGRFLLCVFQDWWCDVWGGWSSGLKDFQSGPCHWPVLALCPVSLADKQWEWTGWCHFENVKFLIEFSS